MKTQFANAARCGTLLLAATLLAGCSSTLYGLLEPSHPKLVDFSEGYVWQPCQRIIETSSKKKGEDGWVPVPGHYLNAANRVVAGVLTLGFSEITPGKRRVSKGSVMGKCGGQDWVGLEFSLVQLDADALSITTKDDDINNVDKYTLLVVAEKGLHDGFKYARFEGIESRDETEHVPLTTTTTSGGSSVDLSGLTGLYGGSLAIGSSSGQAQSTVSGGHTKTTSYGRNHTVKYFNQKVDGAFNLQAVAASIKRQGGSDWEVRGLD